MDDPSKYVVCGESAMGGVVSDPVALAYPDAYAMCGASPGSVICCDGNWVDWDNCSWSQDCGADHDVNWGDTQIRKRNAYPRHMGGSNVGFADGHAKWYNSEAILNDYGPDDGEFVGGAWRYECYGLPGAGEARAARDTWGGFEGGIARECSALTRAPIWRGSR